MSGQSLTGKVAVVTGASRGIGRAIALALAAEGAAVLVNFVRDGGAAEELVAGIVAAGGRASAARADLSRAGEAQRLFTAAEERLGRVDVLVCNAGVSTVLPLERSSEAEYERIFGVNVRGMVFLLKEAALRLKDNGRVITLSSSLAVTPSAGVALYAASKAAIRTLTEVAAIELGPRGITANCVLPGLVETPMVKDMPAPYKKLVAESSPFRRIGAPDDIAGIVAFLASDAARWVTGQAIVANGGARR